MEGPSGYVVCIQPKLSHRDYASPRRFQQKMQHLMQKMQRKLQDENNQIKLVVFPELIGAWLVGIGSMKQPKNGQHDLTTGASSTAALLSFIYNNPALFFSNYFYSLLFGPFSVMHATKKYHKIDPNTGRKRIPASHQKPNTTNFLSIFLAHAQRTVLQLRAKAIFNAYFNTFSQLARNHNAYIVAGSLFLPRLEWKPDKIGLSQINSLQRNTLHKGSRSRFNFDSLMEMRSLHDKEVKLTSDGLYNVAISFNPQGEICNISYKSWLIKEEQTFLDSMPIKNLTAFDCPLGRVAVPICADR